MDRARALAEAAAEAEAAFIEGREAPVVVIPSGATWKPQASVADNTTPLVHEDDAEELLEEEPLEDVEHLQLTLHEAFFLMWTMGCLTVLDPTTVAHRIMYLTYALLIKYLIQNEALDLKTIWSAFRAAYHPPGIPSSLTSAYLNRFDNPFLIHYAAYHYYRSHGWVVKGGIKFCVDYLLYKRGPVFQHAEYVESHIRDCLF